MQLSPGKGAAPKKGSEMIVKPTQGPTSPQTSHTILRWLMDKATVTADGTRRFSGRLSHEAVAELIAVIKAVCQVERVEVPFDGGTLYNYNFIIVHTVKGRFWVSIRRLDGRPPGGKYEVNFRYQALSLDELLEMRGM